MKNIIVLGTHKNMYIVIDYRTGERISDLRFATLKEAIEWDNKRQKRKIEDREIYNNLVIYKKMEEEDFQKVVEEQEREIEKLRDELEDKNDVISELEQDLHQLMDNFKD